MDGLIPATLYGGFFAVDLRMLGLVSLLSLLLSLGTVLAITRLRLGRQMVPWLLAGAVGYLVLLLLVFHWVLDYPVLVIRSFFEIQ